jgi:hypothetical protein
MLADLEAPAVSREELYESKFAAAIGWQPSPDLFEMMRIFEHEKTARNSASLRGAPCSTQSKGNLDMSSVLR